MKAKYLDVVDQLKEEITTGKFKPGDRFYSDAQLLERFSVSRTATLNAVRALVGEGFLNREHGKGTFVRDNNSIKLTNIVGLVMFTSGHLWRELSNQIISKLQANDYFMMIYDPIDSHTSTARKKNYESVSKLVSNTLAGMIIDGMHALPFDYLAESGCKNLVFIDKYEADLEIDASYVLSDYWKGGYNAARYLIDKGHKRIMVITPEGLRVTPTRHSLLDGFQTACDESNLVIGKDIHVVFDPSYRKDEMPEIVPAFNSKRPPTAIFGEADYRVVRIIPTLKRLGLRVPEDVAVMGYYNTPWTTMSEVPLTSVSICEDEMAEIACNLVLRGAQGEHVRERHVLVPRIVERASTMNEWRTSE